MKDPLSKVSRIMDEIGDVFSVNSEKTGDDWVSLRLTMDELRVLYTALSYSVKEWWEELEDKEDSNA
jgi:hypothetical protein